MNKHVFLYQNKQSSFGCTTLINLNKMIKLKRLYLMNLRTQKPNSKRLLSLFLPMMTLLTGNLFGQTISSSLSFSLKSGPVFPVDANNCGIDLPTAHFIAVEAYNSSGSATINVGTLTLDSIPTNWSIKGPISGINKIGYLSPGQRKTVYFYLRAKCVASGTALSFRFKAQNATNYQYYRPSVTLESVITAAAGGSLVSKLSPARILGGYVWDTVTYAFSSFRTGYHMVFSPTSAVTFKYKSLNLESVEILSADAGLGISAGTKDILYFTAGSNASGSTNYNMTVLYKWRIVGVADTIVIAPFVCQEQGGSPGNIKGIRGDTTKATGKLVIVPLNANTISVEKTCNVSTYAAGDTVTYNIKLVNSSSSADVVVDEIRDTLPAGFKFIRLANGTDFTETMMSSIPSSGATGALQFLAGVTDNTSGEVSMTIPKSGSKTLKIRAFVTSGTTGLKINKSAAYIQTTRLDSGYAYVNNNAPNATFKAKSNVKCFGGNDGSLEVQVSGGTPTFRYSIYGGSPYQYSPKFVNLYAGNYVVTVTDTNGLTDTVQIAISEPSSALGVSTPASLLKNIDCKGNNSGFVEAAVTGGTNPYTYSWNSTPTQNTAKASNLVAGTYIVTVTDANNCIATKTIVLTEPTALTLSGSVTNVDCKGNSTGSVVLTAGGGTSPYTYKNGTG
ncbi:MAG: hypothetical protein RLZZ44_288, partial [Bacteroidota bacterium]